MGGVVFIDAVEADQRIEDEQDRLVVLDGVPTDEEQPPDAA